MSFTRTLAPRERAQGAKTEGTEMHDSNLPRQGEAAMMTAGLARTPRIMPLP